MTAACSRDIPKRHHLAWLADGPDLAMALAPLELEVGAAVATWVGQQWPVVVCRQGPDCSPDEVAVGLPLQLPGGRRRVGLRAARRSLRTTAPPPLLDAVAASAPHRWQGPLQVLAREGAALGLELRVYGSLAWQHLTGQAYLRPGSDVDLLFRVDGLDQFVAAGRLLLGWEERFGLRADGELMFGEGAAVAWRELLDGRQRQVLVKLQRTVALHPTGEVLAALAATKEQG